MPSIDLGMDLDLELFIQSVIECNLISNINNLSSTDIDKIKVVYKIKYDAKYPQNPSRQ